MANLTPKIPPEKWISAAKKDFIGGGIQAVRIDRLAKALGVTRGGFYHHFRNRSHLLAALLDDWRTTNRFFPNLPVPTSARGTREFLRQVTLEIIAEKRFDPRYDSAVRDWARVDANVKRVLKREDDRRIAFFQRVYQALGSPPKEAFIRARIFYFHQVGYYTMQIRESKRQRLDYLDLYLKSLVG